jgi:hypothetical protein
VGTAELDMRKMLFRKALVLKLEAERKGAAEKKVFFAHFIYCAKPNICQDRLGTNIGTS